MQNICAEIYHEHLLRQHNYKDYKNFLVVSFKILLATNRFSYVKFSIHRNNKTVLLPYSIYNNESHVNTTQTSIRIVKVMCQLIWLDYTDVQFAK